MLANERDNIAVARAMGIQKAFDLYYRNHILDGVSRSSCGPAHLPVPAAEGRHGSATTLGRIRGEPGPLCHRQCVEAACWMAGSRGLSRALRGGSLAARGQAEVLLRRGPQLVNRVVDVLAFIDQKIG